jgi:hypothetical protein
VPEIDESRVFPKNSRTFQSTFIEWGAASPLVISLFVHIIIGFWIKYCYKKENHLDGIAEDP